MKMKKRARLAQEKNGASVRTVLGGVTGAAVPPLLFLT